MYGVVLEIARAGVAVQALVVLESARNADRGRIRWRAHVLHVDALQSLHLVLQRTVDGIVRVAGVAGHVRRHAVILKVLRGQMAGIIHVQASSVGNHYMARNAELSLLGTLDVRVHSAHDAQGRKHAQTDERQDFPAGGVRQRRPDQKNAGQHDAQDNLTDENPDHPASCFR